MAKLSPSAAMRKELRTKIKVRIKQLGLKRSAAGKSLAMTAAQISRLQRNEDIFSLDRLVDAAVRVGLGVRLDVTRPYGQERAGNRRPVASRSAAA